jgi:hypothetical protein
MSEVGLAVESAGTIGAFTRVADVLPPAVKLAAMPNRNDNSPQGRLENIVGQALFRIDAEISMRENPPHEFFKASVVLEELRGKLSEYRAAQIKKGEYTVLTQLITNEITAIDDCLSSSCIAQANGLLDAYQRERSIAKPGVVIKHDQPVAAI